VLSSIRLTVSSQLASVLLMDEGLVKLLEEAGLSDKESRVYLALLATGQATVNKIAQVTKLKRPIIYVTLESLEKIGYASKVPNKTVSTYSAGDPAVISAQLSTTSKHFQEMLPYLQTLGARTERRPKISSYDSVEAIWRAFKEQSLESDVSVITSYGRIYNLFPKLTEEWLKNCEKGVYKLKNWRHIITDEPKDIEIGKRLTAIGQKVKAIRSANTHLVDLVVYDNKVSLALIDKEPFINIIESEPLALSMRGIFEVVWKDGKWVR